VGELLGGALDLRTHIGLVVLPVADVPGHQLVFELGQLASSASLGSVWCAPVVPVALMTVLLARIRSPPSGMTGVGDERASNRVNRR